MNCNAEWSELLRLIVEVVRSHDADKHDNDGRYCGCSDWLRDARAEIAKSDGK